MTHKTGRVAPRSEERESADVLPAGLNVVLALLCIGLFASRWIAVPFLLYAGLMNAGQIAEIDGGLLRVYLILLATAIVVVALRAVRHARSSASSSIRRSK